MTSRRKTDKYKHIFDHVPVAILELDYTPLTQLARQLSKQTVTNIRQYLTEHPGIVRKTFKKIKLLDTNNAAFVMFGTKSRRELFDSLDKTFSTVALDVLIEKFVALLEGDKEFSGEFKCRSADKRKIMDVFLRVSVPSKQKGDLSRVLISLLDITPWKNAPSAESPAGTGKAAAIVFYKSDKPVRKKTARRSNYLDGRHNTGMTKSL